MNVNRDPSKQSSQQNSEISDFYFESGVGYQNHYSDGGNKGDRGTTVSTTGTFQVPTWTHEKGFTAPSRDQKRSAKGHVDVHSKLLTNGPLYGKSTAAYENSVRDLLDTVIRRKLSEMFEELNQVVEENSLILDEADKQRWINDTLLPEIQESITDVICKLLTVYAQQWRTNLDNPPNNDIAECEETKLLQNIKGVTGQQNEDFNNASTDFITRQSPKELCAVAVKVEPVDEHSAAPQHPNTCTDLKMADTKVKTEKFNEELEEKHEIEIDPNLLVPQTVMYSQQLPAEIRWEPERQQVDVTSEPHSPLTESHNIEDPTQLPIEVEEHQNALYQNTGSSYSNAAWYGSTTDNIGSGSQEIPHRWSSDSQNNEMQKDVGEKIYKCGHCDYGASLIKNLQSHMNKHCIEKPYKCVQCAYSTNHRKSLHIHMRKHTGEKPHKCDRCDYSASHLISLRTHMYKHTGNKPYKCEQCDYSTALVNCLRIHMRKHTGEKPYKCGQCDYSTTQSSNLQKHMQKHSGERPYKCELCEYTTGRTTSLRKHMRTHTGEKLYKCEQCDYAASHRPSFVNHRAKHTVSDQQYKCEQCSFSASEDTSLVKHVRKMHSDTTS